jgi:hypothetical protein
MVKLLIRRKKNQLKKEEKTLKSTKLTSQVYNSGDKTLIIIQIAN